MDVCSPHEWGATAVREFASDAALKLHAPDPFAVAEPSKVAPSNTLTMLLAAAVPARVTVVALVMPSPTKPVSGEKDDITGTAGGVLTLLADAILQLGNATTATSYPTAFGTHTLGVLTTVNYNSTAAATERCRPPVQPNATVR